MDRRRAALFCLAVTAFACGRNRHVELPPPTPARMGAVETGMASWYGRPYHGRRTSNGEIYNMRARTAAHLSLPFNTMVRVTNLTNGRSVDLRINDRGPFLKDRLIDVSRAAAEELDMIAAGTARVQVEVIAAPGEAWSQPPSRDLTCEAGTAVQIGSYRDSRNAARALEGLAPRYEGARVVTVASPQGPLHRVVVVAPDAAEAQRTLGRLAAEGVQGFITRIAPGASCNLSPPDVS